MNKTVKMSLFFQFFNFFQYKGHCEISHRKLEYAGSSLDLDTYIFIMYDYYCMIQILW